MTKFLPPRAIIFDWDNTLVDSWSVIQAALNATLAAMGHDIWDLEMIKARVALSLRDSFPGLFGARWEEARDIFYREYEAVHLEKLTPLSHIPAMLKTLAEASLPLGVVSNKRGEFLRREAQHLGWDGYFQKIVGATDAEADKPSPAPVLMVLETMKIPAGPHVWFVGDAEVDMECALNAGCVPVLLREEKWRSGEFQKFAPALHFSDCRDLLSSACKSAVP